jgi:ribose/xylose/arabinose/galactoside ABC-type transport system permease subunit
MLTDQFTAIGSGIMPILIFVATAVLFHIAPRYTKYGKYTYAIGGTSLSGGIGKISGTVVGTLILGVMISGFTFLGVDAYIQDIVKGVIIVAAVVADQSCRRRPA